MTEPVMNDPLVTLVVEQGVATLTLQDLPHRNALRGPLAAAALAAVRQAAADEHVRVLVLRARGRAFSVGAHLGDLRDPARAAAQVNELMGDGNSLINALHAFPRPVLSVVQGVAAGGGVGLALAADVVLTARSASFVLPFVPALGLVPDMGVAWRLVRSLGRARATALCLMGNPLSAQEAAHCGLVWDCVDDGELDARAAQAAARLAALPAHGAVEVRALLDEAERGALPSLLAYERARQVALAGTPIFNEGVEAFLGKRAPVFHKVDKAAGSEDA